MIQDPDYARIFTKIRCTAWQYGYAAMAHGSFTRDLDVLLVPWTDAARATPDQLMGVILSRDESIQDSGHRPSLKPHGRLTYTLSFKEFGDPRFIDVGFMPLVAAPKGEPE